MRKENERAKIIGRRLKAARMSRVPKVKQEDAAGHVGIPWRRYQSYERGWAVAPKEVLEELGLWWRISDWEDYFYGVDERSPYPGVRAATEAPSKAEKFLGVRPLVDGGIESRPMGAIAVPDGLNPYETEAVGITRTATGQRLREGDIVFVVKAKDALPHTLVRIQDDVEEQRLVIYTPGGMHVFSDLDGEPILRPGRITGRAVHLYRELGPGWIVNERCETGLPWYG